MLDEERGPVEHGCPDGLTSLLPVLGVNPLGDRLDGRLLVEVEPQQPVQLLGPGRDLCGDLEVPAPDGGHALCLVQGDLEAFAEDGKTDGMGKGVTGEARLGQEVGRTSRAQRDARARPSRVR